MGRVINTDGPGKRRNHLMRTGAEILKHLSQKPEIDDDAKDMMAMLFYCLRDIDTTIDESVEAWEKRDYWMKTEKFRRDWYWVADMSNQLRKLLINNDWDNTPTIMIQLMPYFADVKVARFTRSESEWRHAYERLLHEHKKSII